ncbi:hypothetical protein INT47_003935, partial [Mucor saturninus]
PIFWKNYSASQTYVCIGKLFYKADIKAFATILTSSLAVGTKLFEDKTKFALMTKQHTNSHRKDGITCKYPFRNGHGI